MKKPIISLAAVGRIDAVPLRKALEIHQKATGEIAAARMRETALHKEINDFLANTSPDDEAALQLISGKKIQAEILPNLIKKVEQSLEAKLAPALMGEAGKFQDGLRRFYREAHEAIAVQLAETFRPFFTTERFIQGERVDLALATAKQTDDCMAISMRLAEAEQIRLPVNSVRSNAPQKFDSELVQAAEQLLALAARA